MNISISLIRAWLNSHWMALAAGMWLGAAGMWAQSVLDLSQHSRASTVAVNDSTPTPFTNPLNRANFVQLSLIPADEQVFTYCKPAGDCIQVPSGLTFEIGPLRQEMQGGQALGTVQVTSGTATLQVEAARIQ